MTRLALASAVVLTVVMFITGYISQFLTTAIAIWLDLPGPYYDGLFAWVWFAFGVLIFLSVGFLFCRWLIRLVERKVRTEGVFK